MRARLSILCVVTMLVVGCAAPARSTRFAASDFEQIAQAIAHDLYASDAIARRTPDSPRWVVSFDKVTNLTSDVITAAEQGSIMARIVGAAPITELNQRKNMAFVIPPQRTLALRQQGMDDEADLAYGSQRGVNHTLTATFRSLTRAGEKERTEVYLCSFALLDLQTHRLVWSGQYELKRSAIGNRWD